MTASSRRGGTDIFAYEPRRLWSDAVVEVGGYRIKPYRMAFPSEDAEREALSAALPPLLARAVPAIDDPNYHGLGFAVFHVARDGNYLLTGRWYAGNNLMSEAFEIVGDLASGEIVLKKLSLFACIWEMAVYAFERDCWVRTIMGTGRGLDGAPAYLECRFGGWV